MPNLSWKDAILAVLNEASEPVHYTDIAEAIADQDLRGTSGVGANPANSVAATIAYSFRSEKDGSPFIRVGGGYYALKQDEADTTFRGDSEEEEAEDTETGIINAFGMYWQRDKILWRTAPKLFGQQQPGSTPVDLSEQKGVYMLYDRRDVIYIGRATTQTIGARLNQHTMDRLNGRWNRFSWFGVYPVQEDGTLSTTDPESWDIDTLIVTMEALLIEGLEPPQNRQRGDGFRAVEFLQTEDPQIEKQQFQDVLNELARKAFN